MISKRIQQLVRELEEIRKKPGPEAEKKARELSCQIAKKIPQKFLRQALQHPREVRNLIHPQDTNRHPMLL